MGTCTSNDGARFKSLNSLKALNREALARWSASCSSSEQQWSAEFCYQWYQAVGQTLDKWGPAQLGHCRLFLFEKLFHKQWQVRAISWKIAQVIPSILVACKMFPHINQALFFHSVKVFINSKHALADWAVFALSRESAFPISYPQWVKGSRNIYVVLLLCLRNWVVGFSWQNIE